MSLILHSFFRSSTSFRVRVALNLKEQSYEQLSYNFREEQQRSEKYLALNAQGLVPTLTTSEGEITQSLAILEWLDETFPQPSLLPKDPFGRARVRSLAHAIALDTHPINNLRVLNRLRGQLGANDEDVADWFRHWVALSFDAIETRLSRETQTGTFCHGDEISQADICLAAQSVNNVRFNVDETPYPIIRGIVANCLKLPAFEKALPKNQPDAV
ncbi:MAG: maleylacetoacetate isomerase [Nitratireductor sp.]